MDLYSSQIACRVCGLTPRTLDYWITTRVMAPSQGMLTTRRGRKYFLFTFEDLVQLKVVKSLRDAGVTLGAIRTALSELRKRHGRSWQKAWLRTDGKGIFRATDDPAVVESLVKGEVGQLAMSIVAVGRVQEWVRKNLKGVRTVDPSRYEASLLPWRRLAGA